VARPFDPSQNDMRTRFEIDRFLSFTNPCFSRSTNILHVQTNIGQIGT
jgi:hypothetical protein